MVIIERSKEYDAFGPWIYEIDQEHEVPEIFRSYCDRSGNHLILFKVPRKIERRDASRDMDLYDYLVGAYDKYLHILKRIGKSVTERILYYYDITAVKDIHALLKGDLILFTQNGQEVIEYNTVSEEIILKLINIIEGKIAIDTQRILIEGIPADNPDEGKLGILFFNLFNELQTINPELSLCAYQTDIYIRRTRELRKKLEETRISLSKIAFIVDDKELIVLERKVPIRKRYKEEYEYSYLYIPFQNITGAVLKELDNQRYLYILELKAKGQKFSYIFDNGNKKMFDLYHKLYNFNRIA